jgi:beta-lactamase regulating signal transducer with metallopeptidase domain/protocatechuate 3,4-dioxygenase beta subunit
MADDLIRLSATTPNWLGGLAWALVWQSTLWLAIGLLAGRVWRRRAGRAHLLLILATSAAVVSPLLTATVRRLEWGVLPPTPIVASDAPNLKDAPRMLPQEPVVSTPVDLPIDVHKNSGPDQPASWPVPPAVPTPVATIETAESASQPETLRQPWRPQVARLLPLVLAGLWLAASFLLAIRLAISLLAGRRIAREARETATPQLSAALREAADGLSLATAPHLRVSARVLCPMIWCWGSRAVVLVPVSAPDQAGILWRSVFCHELAHLVRRDHWSALWAELVVILLPWQPLGWWCRRRLGYLREQACDDWVLSAGGAATDYAESLLQFVPQKLPSHALAAVTSRKSLKRRLEHVLAGVRIAPKVGNRWIVASSLLALAAIAGVGFAQQGKRSRSAEPQVTGQVKDPALQKTVPAATPSGIVTVRGRVLLPDGRPAVGAIVHAIKTELGSFATAGKTSVLSAPATDSRGEFQVAVDFDAIIESRASINLWATLNGYGLALHSLAPGEQTDSIVMNLLVEEPIRGRIIDLEGRPVPQARVELTRYTDTTTAWIDQWLASFSEKTVGSRIANPEQPSDEARSSDTEAVLRVKSRRLVSDTVVAPVKTNADGRFEFRGLGRDRLFGMAISGPHIVKTDAGVLTRPIKPVRLKHEGLRGSQFERVVSPSVPVEGFVTDEETGKPIPGARILPTATARGNGRAVGDPQLAALVSRTTDATGHFRLEGLDTSSLNYCAVSVSESPYPSAFEVELPASENLQPIHRDIKLRRGAWAIGRAYNHLTGQPVAGALYYTPFRSNEFVRKYQLGFYSDYRTFPVGFTDAEGHFRVPVIPGPGMIQLRCTAGDYCFNFGKEKIKEFSDPKSVLYAALRTGGFHSVCGIDVAPDAHEAKIELPVDPGQNVTLRFVDASGKALTGIETYGLRFDRIAVPGQGRSYTPGDSAVVYALSPNERRELWLKQRSSGLSRLLQFTPKPQEAERVIVLERAAVVTGRVVSPEGAPLTKLRIECDFSNSFRLPVVMTDADGRFREELPAGGPFSLSARVFFAQIVKDLNVAAGEHFELGDITIERDAKRPGIAKVQRGPEKRTNPRSDVSRSALTLSGNVLNETGTPIAGARVSATATGRVNEAGGALKDHHEVLGEATTDATGTFHIDIAGVSTKSHRYPVLMAASDGYGLASQSFNLDGNNPNATFHLAREQIVRGRFVDLQGQSAAGVSAHVGQITLAPMVFLPPDSANWSPNAKVAAAWPKSITSDEQGRFAIRGVAANQVIYLSIDGNDQYARQFLPLNRRRGEAESTFASLRPGEEAVLPLSPATVIEGVIRFADTKQPARNARFTVYASQQKPPFGSFVGLSGQADERGHFRVVPYPGIYFQVTAYPPQGTPYLIRQNAAEVKTATTAAEINVDLPRGVHVRGKILDADERPIANASIQYIPTAKTQRRAGAKIITGWQGIALSDANGAFAISVLPGPGHLLVHGPTPEYVYQEIGDRELGDGRPGGRRNYAHAIVQINPPNDSASPIELTPHLKRGMEIDGRLLAPDGHAVEEAVMISRLQINPASPTWRGIATEIVHGGRFAVSGCSPGVPCPVYCLDPEHQTGATLRVEASSAGQEPLTVRLAPCGTAKARFVDSEGKPIADLEPSLHLVVTAGVAQFDRSPAARGKLMADEDFAVNIDPKNQHPLPKTGADGVATFRALIPGAAYELHGGRNRELAVLKEFAAEASKTLDLGDIVADRPRGR